jgi:FeS assembly SUF system protein
MSATNIPDTSGTPDPAQSASPAGQPDARTAPSAAAAQPEAQTAPSASQHTLRDDVEAALHTVFDPEIPVNIFELGLVYEIKIGDNGHIKITMTLTAQACPVAGDIVREVQEKIEALPGVLDCHVQLTFDPPWTRDMMTEEAKLELGFL